MDKPFTLAVKETMMKLAEICNKSGLPPVVLDLIIQNLYSEVHNLSERQALLEIQSLKEEQSSEGETLNEQ
jgi:hypothetical protein